MTPQRCGVKRLLRERFLAHEQPQSRGTLVCCGCLAKLGLLAGEASRLSASFASRAGLELTSFGPAVMPTGCEVSLISDAINMDSKNPELPGDEQLGTD